jgi:hypothetical protein
VHDVRGTVAINIPPVLHRVIVRPDADDCGFTTGSIEVDAVRIEPPCFPGGCENLSFYPYTPYSRIILYQGLATKCSIAQGYDNAVSPGTHRQKGRLRLGQKEHLLAALGYDK